MKRVVTAAALFLVIFGVAASAAAAESRVALVIGNSAYEDSPLANPANDARLMAETLRGLGFDVIERTDADQKQMKLAIFELGDRLEAAGRDAVGLFYYAGHGVQVDGENYLIPLGAAISKERHVAIEAVGANWVLGQMEFAGNRVNFVILDACRNNPLTRGFRSQVRGLAKMNAPTGSLVAYSTGPGDVAADGESANSPYTRALAQAMQLPGLPAEKVFKLVRDAVREETGGEQTPWEESSMTGADFYFNIDVSVTVATTDPTATDTEATERLFWESIKDSADPASFEVYLAEYPNGKFAALARLRIVQLGETQTAAVVPPPTPSSQAAEPAVGVYPKTYQPGDTFMDCDTCPEMVVIPKGAFTMGSPSSEVGRWANEGPVHRVQLRSFALGKYEVTRGQFDAFVRDTGYSAGGDCYVDKGGGEFGKLASKNWRDPNYAQTDQDPAVCISWEYANAYIEWLAWQTGKPYRLPSESEWEYAARAGTTTARHWGDDPDEACASANVFDRTSKSKNGYDWAHHDCTDDHAHTAPVGNFRPNGFGLYDMLGNAWEWVEDCWNGSYSGAPSDGSAWSTGECGERVLRGGSWDHVPKFVRAAYRGKSGTGYRDFDYGFRIARTIAPDEAAAAAGVQTAALAGDAALGARVFKVCGACHTIAEGGRHKLGPNLFGVFGRAAASAPDFDFSDEMRSAAVVWDEATLDRYIAKPTDVVAKDKMLFDGVKDERDRRDLIAFLKSASQ